MTPLLTPVLVLMLLISSCGGGNESGSWRELQSTLTRGLDEASPNLCVRGDPGCIDLIITEMTNRLEPLENSCDHDAAFSLMYLDMTRTVAEDMDAGSFDDISFLSHLDAVFADFYFDAFDAWHADNPDLVPPAWQVAFNAADERSVTGIGNLLLGANAHIRRDLAFVMEAIGTVGKDGTDRRPDYDKINAVIVDLTRPLLSNIAARLDPSIALFDIPFVGLDEQTAGAILEQWRTEAFNDAARLLAADSSAARDEIAAEIDAKALETSRLILAGTHYLPFIPGAVVRDNLCRLGK